MAELSTKSIQLYFANLSQDKQIALGVIATGVVLIIVGFLLL